MQDKKITTIFSILLFIVLIGGLLILKNVNKNKQEAEAVQMEEYTPQEEISDEQAKQTIASLYFLNKETKELTPEARLVNIKEIVTAPYDTLINLLIAGPKSEKLDAIIPENTKLRKASIEGDVITLDFSSEFLEYDKNNKTDATNKANEASEASNETDKVGVTADDAEKENLINSIVNTLTQLTEVNKVKILIDGNPSDEFSETYSI